ncbi:MAG: sigma-70 family RNA polymerase sigma factor [Lewinellaceae bacterium]|nr:sigma-70 family RNA polymerase sigma factor [Saprospiraceae bacterium]MCB9313654.1 sigma-70 family RNA polymerase sigma factor [Lewinellaceae bacterium]HRW75099.1 sigma-70 family RNA polymerase sigma factor [Saprospiraceae bacterium]
MDVTLHLTADESDLIAACVRQERWAQQRVYEEHYGKMMGVCLRYANHEEDALDMLHEGFIKVFRYISRYKSGTSLQAWIRTIIVNTCIDHYRRNHRRRTDDLDQVQTLSNGEISALDMISAEEILGLVRELTPSYRVVFNLYVLEGYSHKEIADMLDITESTSRSNLVKARLKLQHALKLKWQK